jgi:hypothetical protein
MTEKEKIKRRKKREKRKRNKWNKIKRKIAEQAIGIYERALKRPMEIIDIEPEDFDIDECEIEKLLYEKKVKQKAAHFAKFLEKESKVLPSRPKNNSKTNKVEN